jgi:hypothetical protein
MTSTRLMQHNNHYNKAIALDPEDAYAIKGRDYLMAKKNYIREAMPDSNKAGTNGGKIIPN